MRKVFMEMSLQSKTRHRINLAETLVQGCPEKHINHPFVMYTSPSIHDILVEYSEQYCLASVVLWSFLSGWMTCKRTFFLY